MPVRLHFAWDAMLGEEPEINAILATTLELKQHEQQHAADFAEDHRRTLHRPSGLKKGSNWPKRTSICTAIYVPVMRSNRPRRRWFPT